jgi:hypothetical protein
MTATATIKYQPVLNEDTATAIKVVFGALSEWEHTKKVANEAGKAYRASLVHLPSIYQGSNLCDPRNGSDVKGLLALGDLPESREQSMRYYLRGGRVMTVLQNDGKTSPAAIMTAVNSASQKDKGITIGQIDDLIDGLVKVEGATWADFVTAVANNTVDKKADNAITALEKQDTLNAGQIARIERLLAKHTK